LVSVFHISLKDNFFSSISSLSLFFASPYNSHPFQAFGITGALRWEIVFGDLLDFAELLLMLFAVNSNKE